MVPSSTFPALLVSAFSVSWVVERWLRPNRPLELHPELSDWKRLVTNSGLIAARDAAMIPRPISTVELYYVSRYISYRRHKSNDPYQIASGAQSFQKSFVLSKMWIGYDLAIAASPQLLIISISCSGWQIKILTQVQTQARWKCQSFSPS